MALGLLLTSCTDNDDNTNPPAGTYSLVRVAGGIMGSSWDLPAQRVIWDINTAQDSVTVTNNLPQNGTPSAYASGRYAYSVTNNPGENGACAASLYINQEYFGCYSTANDTLFVNDLHADGFLYTFVKNH